MMKKSLILSSILFSLVLFVFSLASSENLNVTCEAGGPYIKGGNIIVKGNVTNITGTIANVTVKINATTVIATKNTTSGDAGNYHVTFPQTIDVGTYTVNSTAERLGVYGNCTTDLVISYPGATGLDVNRTITINGTAVYRNTGKVLTSGMVYLAVVGQDVKSTASINSDGKFSVSVYPLLTLGTKYYLNLVTEDVSGKRSWMQILYVTT